MVFLCAFSAFLVGCLAAVAELLSRYKNIKQILSVPASWVYLTINGIASCVAYFMVVKYGVAKDNTIFQIIIAGTSALVILRSSIANVKVGDKNTDIGIASILQVFLNAADRSFDQTRSNYELSEIEEIMKSVDFEKAKLALPITCFNSMRNVPEDEQKRISADVEKLSKENLDNRTKSINLGIILARATELKLLKKSVDILGASVILDGEKTPSQILDDLLKNLSKP